MLACLMLLFKWLPVLWLKHRMFGSTVDLLSDGRLMLRAFGALCSLPTQYLAASNESVYMHEFVMLSKCLRTSVG